MQLAGPELRYLVPWVMFALKTGQVFGLRPEQVTKEAVEQIVTGLRTQGARLGGASLPGERLQALAEQVKGSASGKVLLSLIRAAGGKGFGAYPPSLAPALDSLSTRLGGVLEDFLRAPGDEAFREIRQTLTPEEKGVLGILQRVSRAQ
jgi:hypothetical protein